MPVCVVSSGEAAEDQRALYAYIAADAGAEVATASVEVIVAYCESFATFPMRGRLRDRIQQGLRIVGVHRRVSVAFVAEPQRDVTPGIFYSSRDRSRNLMRIETPC